MILQDNETRLDLLNNRAIAKTIVKIIQDTTEPITIGVHGDWGVGKSSVLAMIEEELNPDGKGASAVEDWDESEEDTWDGEIDAADRDGVVTIRFNSWQYQGFEDAKIALMSAMVSALENRTKTFYKEHRISGGLRRVKEIAGRLWKNLDKLGIAKNAAKLGVAVATGTAPIALATTLLDVARNEISDSEKVAGLIGEVGELLKAPEAEPTAYGEMEAFRANFRELLEESHAEELVVLIDDLDRCLPKVAIETLEAIRLFLSLENTAFVIAADDAMIRYFVREYFPRTSNDSDDGGAAESGQDYRSFADKYLEKLIQVPFYIPCVGSVEARLYTTLLLVESAVGKVDGFRALARVANDRMCRPWSMEQLSIVDIRQTLGSELYDKAVEQVNVAKRIDKVLAENAGGNPRNIKRFINTLLLRIDVARNRGLTESELEMSVLAKMMLAEQYNRAFYKAIAGELDAMGVCPAFVDNGSNEPQKTEGALSDEDSAAKGIDGAKMLEDTQGNNREGGNEPTASVSSEFAKMLEDEAVRAWMDIEPSLEGKDLRPYFFVCREKVDIFSGDVDEKIRELVTVIGYGAFSARQKEDEIVGLDTSDAKKLFDIVADAAIHSNLSTTECPKSIEGMRVLVKLRPELRGDLIDFLMALPPVNLGQWSVGGWEECIPSNSDMRNQLNEFLLRVEKNNRDAIVSKTAKRARLGM